MGTVGPALWPPRPARPASREARTVQKTSKLFPLSSINRVRWNAVRQPVLRGVKFEQREGQRVSARNSFVVAGLLAGARQWIVLPENLHGHLREHARLVKIDGLLGQTPCGDFRADGVRETLRPRVHVLFGPRAEVLAGDSDDQFAKSG